MEKIREIKYREREISLCSMDDFLYHLRKRSDLKKDLSCLFRFGTVHYEEAEAGKKIYTPGYPVEDITRNATKENLSTYSKLVYHPNFKNGKFIVNLMHARLEKAKLNKDTFVRNMLESVSTVYGSDNDPNNVYKLRNNLYTLVMDAMDEIGISLTPKYDAVLKYILVSNIFVAEFTDPKSGPILVQHDKLYFVRFPKWNFTKDRFSLNFR